MMWMCLKTPVGLMRMEEEGGALTRLDFTDTDLGGKTTPLLEEARRQLMAYFDGRLRAFDLPLAPRGTPFQLAVWQALRGIPYGQTCSYGEIARAIDRPRACRAVGMANHRNPISIVVPCHRVIGADGGLTGYGGGLEAKRFLLDLERRNLRETP